MDKTSTHCNTLLNAQSTIQHNRLVGWLDVLLYIFYGVYNRRRRIYCGVRWYRDVNILKIDFLTAHTLSDRKIIRFFIFIKREDGKKIIFFVHASALLFTN